MIAICDSGGSKGDWAFVNGPHSIIRVQTAGFNPFTHDGQHYQDQLNLAFAGLPVHTVHQVYYYGAGCRETDSKMKVQAILQQLFQHATTEVQTDLLAAAKATCGLREGIACIVGTGSNSGVYDGNDIIDSVPTLGYLLGDEGSGAHFGKLLIRSYFYREMPSDIRYKFEIYFPGGHDKILNHLYHQPAPNQFLGSFTKFAHQHLEHPFIQSLMNRNFQDFIDSQLSKYSSHPTLPVHFVGSVAFHFKNELISILSHNHLLSGKILEKPMDELINFHLQYI